MQKVVLATGNAGKVRELASLLEDLVSISSLRPSWAWTLRKRPA